MADRPHLHLRRGGENDGGACGRVQGRPQGECEGEVGEKGGVGASCENFPVFMESLFICCIQKGTVCDYLHILLKLAGANETTKFMAYYLSEMVLLHTIFGRWAMIHSTYTY